MSNNTRTGEAYATISEEIGIIGVGALASALAQAIHRAWPTCQLHLSPRGELAGARLIHQLIATNGIAVRHHNNQTVANNARLLIVGVRPAQVREVAQELQLTADHHVLCVAAGVALSELKDWFAPARVTRLMTGLAVAQGGSAISVYPRAPDMDALLAPLCAAVLGFEKEAQFEASMLAVCANAWWLDQLAALSDWMTQATGMSAEHARTLLATNMADVAALLHMHPNTPPEHIARAIGTPGTFTAQGLDQLHEAQAHAPWINTLQGLLEKLPKNKRP